jgi:hypothetical protein
MLVAKSAASRRQIGAYFYLLSNAVGCHFLFQANTQKKCAFSSLLLELQARPNVQKWERSQKFREGKLKVDTALCDQLAGCGTFTREVFGKDPNILIRA